MNSRRALIVVVLHLAGLLFPGAARCEETYIGRRWFVHVPGGTCHFWGYLRKPGQKWAAAKLVIMDERVSVKLPDRIAAEGSRPVMGSDHNVEYTITGAFTGRYAYDPNSDLVLPLFAARKFVVTSKTPGPLPTVGDPGNNSVVPGREAGRQARDRQ